MYQLGCFICDQSREKELRKFVRDELKKERLRLRRKKKSKYAKSAFYSCLRLVFPTEEMLKSGQKSEIAEELQRAYDAGIQPEHLVGFIYQTNPSQLATKAYERRLSLLKAKRGVSASKDTVTLSSWED